MSRVIGPSNRKIHLSFSTVIPGATDLCRTRLEPNRRLSHFPCMRRTSWFRPIAILLAAWLPLIVGEPGVVHACPTHGAPAIAATAAQHNATVPAGHHHASQAADQPHDSAPSHDHSNCSCISCCAGSAVTPPTPAGVTTIVVAQYETRSARPAAQELPSLAPEFSRPYQTGPPRA
jgi:hypothetical protein